MLRREQTEQFYFQENYVTVMLILFVILYLNVAINFIVTNKTIFFCLHDCFNAMINIFALKYCFTDLLCNTHCAKKVLLMYNELKTDEKCTIKTHSK